MNDHKSAFEKCFSINTVMERELKIAKENCDYLTSKSNEIIKDMLLNLLKHTFDNLNEDKSVFTITYSNDNFDKACLLLINKDYESVKVDLSNLDVIISKQYGHVEFEQVSKFPTEFLYMFT